MQKRSRKRILIISGAALLLAAAVMLLTGIRNRETAAAEGQESAEAFIGDLAANATASGTLLPAVESNLATDQPGRVEAVYVETGDRVSGGDALLQLETTDLALNVRLNEQNVALKEASLAELLDGASEAQLASARAAVANAQAQLDDSLAGPSDEELAALAADLKSAEANTWSSSARVSQTQNAVRAADIAAAEAALSSAQSNLTAVEIQYTRNPSPDNIQANTALAQAREQVNSAQARLHSLLSGPDANQLGSAQAGLSAAIAQQDAATARYDKEIGGPGLAAVAAAQAQLAQAQATLADLVSSPSAEQVAAAEAELAQARIDLTDAEASLDAATIRAPFAGVITAVSFVEGERASGPVLSIFAEDSLTVILEVDEADVASLQVGQVADVSLEAFPESELKGEITAIAPKAAGSPGSTVVVYEVRLALESTALPLRSGMTADANLVLAEREDVLLVPNAAINVDRSAGTTSVNLLVGETVQERPVVIGLRDRQYTQIIGGLNEGDEVVIGNAIPLESAIPTPGSAFGND